MTTGKYLMRFQYWLSTSGFILVSICSKDYTQRVRKRQGFMDFIFDKWYVYIDLLVKNVVLMASDEFL